MDSVKSISPAELTPLVRQDKVLVVDSRTFCEYNTSHIANAVNVWSSKIRKKRLQQCTASAMDFLRQACQVSEKKMNNTKVVVYDQNSKHPSEIPEDSFLHVLLSKLSNNFDEVSLLQGGFLEFQSQFPDVCEDTSPICPTLTSLSQPCLPATKCGFSRILPFLYLGSQNDANSQDLLQKANITYELNVSTSCPKPTFVPDAHFMRIPVNDNFNEKLIPHFAEAFRFIDKAKEAGERVLVHCLAGISRSPTISIAYVMRHLRLHYDEAYRYVKQRRPTISPNINFVGQLLEFDRILMGKSSQYYDHTEMLRASLPSMHKSTSSPSFDRDKYRQPKISLPMLTAQADFFSFKTEEPYVSNRLPSSPTLQEEDIGAFVINEEKENIAFTEFYEDSYTETKNYLESKSMEVEDKTDQPAATEIPIKFSISIPIDISCIQATDSVKVLENVEECKETPNVNVHYENVNPIIVKETKVLVSPDESPICEKPEPATPVVIRTQFDLPKKSVKKSNSIQDKVSDKLLRNEKALPRCYSSSETHLNTRRMLEANKENEGENSTRKSFSTDEVHKGWPLSPQGHFPGLVPCCHELNRCDSWSTSGLGSEISDWESLHDESHPLDDIAGPFDAVFSDVFHGGEVDSVISESSRKSVSSDFKDQSKPKSELVINRNQKNQPNPKSESSKGTRPKQLRPLSHSSSAKNNSTIKEEIQKSIKRPISLPGVSSSYNLNLKQKSASLDLNVALEESPNWRKERKMFNFDPKTIAKYKQEPVEDFDFRIRIAQELVQPVEDMLESEMGDIKERTNALRARYGLSSNPDTSHRSDPSRWSMRKPKEGRAKSEPPLSEEGLYRVRSCPGLPHKIPKDVKSVTIPPIHENRHSCGDLDSLPSFLSKKSIYELKRYLLGISSSSSVPMLQVS